ncbi:LytTR family DNA-binding domain-containing protein [Massilibacteroides sp.]|uniref:LytR/AlgR family response regulator transcription factor n=1 Tax=Massilibacteroides sp. TaxID=2034766 RepID=UPI0026273A30|nr:LytTR family DNA-binding domain-containing protein [Massilibacteroides sp.]MDD4514532.1 LytTR family DNA-binding domain-containing protein [Massilibacteroides sp.]
MLKCITFDGDASTLDTLMGYFEKLDKTLAEVQGVLQKEQNEQVFFVKEGSRIIRILREEIIYLEGYGDYVKIHRTNGKPLLSQVSLRKFEETLATKGFCRVHRSYIVAISHINYIERKRIRIGESLIPISDSYLPCLMKQLMLQE